MGKIRVPAKVRKRDGRIVSFDEERISNSIKKAMIAKEMYDEKLLKRIVGEVLTKCGKLFERKIPSVEEIQDIIEVELMRVGLFDVAKAYILYRNKKSEIREEKKKILNKTELDEVDKRFSINALRLLAARYLLKDETGKPIQTPKELFQSVAVTMAIPEIFYDEKVYDKSGRSAKKKAGDKYKDIEKFDGKFSINGWPINKWNFERLIALYNELGQEGKVKISIEKLLAMLEKKMFMKAETVAMEAYEKMVSRDFLPNTPTLVNSGRKLGMLSACFTLDVEDDMESIMKLARDCAMIHKSGGGTGVNFSKIRPEGDIVASTTGVASGPVSFMKLIDSVSDVIKQGGVRRAANMGILEIWHPDIEKFISAKKKEGFLENFNISVGVNGDFWKYFEKNEEYPLVHPTTGKTVRKVNPRALFRMIAENAWETADPGILFFDNINRRNIMRRTLGEIKVTNPCGEEPLYPYESCNLASINLENFVISDGSGKPSFDWERFHKTVRFVVRVLDNIISVNKYPLSEIEKKTKKTRRIGVGVMGLAHALIKLGIRYNSEDGFEFMKKVSEHLTYYAYEESCSLAEARGPFPLYEKTDYVNGDMPIEGYYHKEEWTCDWNALVSKIKKNGLRNAMVTTAPPTGSIGMIADTSTGIEPVYSLAFEKRVTVGSFYYTNELLEKELERRGINSIELVKQIMENYGSVQGIEQIPDDIRYVFVTSMDVHWIDHLVAQAVMQMWITDSISKTINMPADVKIEDVEQAYLLAHELLCKGITIYKNESKKGQVLMSTGKVKKKIELLPVSKYSLAMISSIIEKNEYVKEYINIKNIPKEPEANMAQKNGIIIKDGMCPECYGQNIHFESGCASCKDCGWSICLIS
ncbi:MAG: adenosylcobalamin-dependent ribonucleoside-diphosphate reductase [Candidatus Micrarchaeia archaeon]